MADERSIRKSGDGAETAQRGKGARTAGSAQEADSPAAAEQGNPSYGGPPSLDASGLILASVGGPLLGDIVGELMDLLDTSCAVYEKNGDYALRTVSSGWCRFMDRSSRRCGAPDEREAAESDGAVRHDSCGREAALRAMETNGPCDVACPGGIRFLAVPICAGTEIVGAIGVGYGDPPADRGSLGRLAALSGVGEDEIRRQAEAHDPRPPFIVGLAKKRILSAARVIGAIVARKRKEKALRRSEERFRALFELAKDVIFIYDQEGHILEANPEACERLGYSHAEFMTMKPFDVDTLEEAALFPERIAILRRQGHHLFETLHQKRDGTVVPVEVSVRLFESAGKRMSLSICRDITERKQAQEALVRSEALMKKSQAVGHVGSWEMDLGTNRLTWSDEVYRIFGLELGEFNCSYEAFLAAVHPDDRERVNAAYQSSLRAGSDTYEIEHRIVRRDNGEVRFMLEKGEHVKDAAGSVVRSVGMVQDVTERKRADEALRESEERFRGIYEASPIGIELYDREGSLVDANPACLDIFGISALEEVLGFRLFEDPNLNGELKARLLRGESVRYELLFDFEKVKERKLYRTTKSGTAHLALLITPLKGAAAESAAGYLVHIRDITESRKIEVKMREMQKLESLGVLAGGIAHDFNNLLMAILGNADLALLSLSPVSPVCQHVQEIVRASQRAADLCRQMLAYSGKGRFVVGRHDVSEIVREMEQILSVSISKKAMIRYCLSEGLPPVESDATQMRQVIMNLITNASDALNDESGVITITTRVTECDEAYLAETYLNDNLPGGTYVTLEVSDTGCGMDAETRGRIFDPFFTTKFTGRGLGLAAVLGIVRGHKGAIKVYSEVGTGTTIKVLLPAAEQQPDVKIHAAEEGEPLQGGGTVLLVDDDPTVRAVAAAMLAKLGFRVLTANNGLEGLKIFRTQGAEIVCVILDLIMPEMGGEETFRELCNLRSDVRVILSSGYNEQDATQRFVGRGLAGFIQKPYTTANLHNALKRVLG